MKMNKKTIVILIVVAVAAYLLWKRGKNNVVVVSESETLTAEPDHTTLDYILTHIDFNSTERKKIESVRQAMETNHTWRQQIQAAAYQKGISFDQQMVMSAIWNLYHTDSGWSTDRGWKLIAQVESI